MPSETARRIIENVICGVENLFCKEFPKRDGYIHAYADQIDALINAEREACAKLADRKNDFSDCEELGAMDHETGMRECGARECFCEPKIEHGEEIAALIRSRSNSK